MSEEKYYWPVNLKTHEVTQTAIKAEWIGGIYAIPVDALQEKPLPSKSGYAVIASGYDDNGTPHSSEYIEDHREETIYHTSDCTRTQVIAELGQIPNGWTDSPPQTEFDQWTAGAWITNLETQYAAAYQQVNETRRLLYTQQVDPLMQEAAVKTLQDKPAEADALHTQALAMRAQIQTDHPWPEKPNSQSDDE
jgi:hypothetical protein